ncbi:hypothetical protein [Hydrogenivirga sp.]
MSYLKKCILSCWEDTKDRRSELEALLTLREYFKSPSADILIHYDPEVNEIYRTTNQYLSAWQLYREAVAESSEAYRLEEESPEAEGQINYLYTRAEEKLTEAMQIVADAGFTGGALYHAIVSALNNIPKVQEVRR